MYGYVYINRFPRPNDIAHSQKIRPIVPYTSFIRFKCSSDYLKLVVTKHKLRCICDALDIFYEPSTPKADLCEMIEHRRPDLMRGWKCNLLRALFSTFILARNMPGYPESQRFVDKTRATFRLHHRERNSCPVQIRLACLRTSSRPVSITPCLH